jgi:hypothetical protein
MNKTAKTIAAIAALAVVAFSAAAFMFVKSHTSQTSLKPASLESQCDHLIDGSQGTGAWDECMHPSQPTSAAPAAKATPAKAPRATQAEIDARNAHNAAVAERQANAFAGHESESNLRYASAYCRANNC